MIEEHMNRLESFISSDAQYISILAALIMSVIIFIT